MKRVLAFAALLVLGATFATAAVVGNLDGQLPIFAQAFSSIPGKSVQRAGIANRVPGSPPPEKKYVPGEILVKIKGAPAHGRGVLSGPALENFLERLPAQARFALGAMRGRALQAFPRIGVLRVGLPMESSVDQAIEELKRSGTVNYAEPNYIFRALPKPSPWPEPPAGQSKKPNDELFDKQWALHNYGQRIFDLGWFYVWGTKDADIDAPEAWYKRTSSATNDGRETIVVVIDTGVQYDHPDLAANMWTNTGEIPGNGVDDDGNGFADDVHGINTLAANPVYSAFGYKAGDPMDDQGHGTHVAGIIGAQGNNGVGVSGINWSTKIMALKFLDADGYGNSADAIICMEYALGKKGSNRMVINASWGEYEYSSPLYEEIQKAGEAGVLFVAAAGNDGYNADRTPMYPASYDATNIISVGASDEDDLKASFSNYGAVNVDLFAPGTWILSTYPYPPLYAPPYEYLDGTSMAAPQVSGACALVWAHREDHLQPPYNFATPQDIQNRILSTVDKKRSFSNKCKTGGRLNLYKALVAAEQP